MIRPSEVSSLTTTKMRGSERMVIIPSPPPPPHFATHARVQTALTGERGLAWFVNLTNAQCEATPAVLIIKASLAHTKKNHKKCKRCNFG